MGVSIFLSAILIGGLHFSNALSAIFYNTTCYLKVSQDWR